MRPIGILMFAGILLATGCTHSYYTPNFLHTPYIEKKGDGIVTAAISGSPVSVNGDFHASYSPVKNGVVMLNFFTNHKSFEENNFFGGPVYVQQSDGFLLEAAVGGYQPLAFGTAALYAGWGKGNLRNDYGISRIASLGLERFFIQPCFTFKNDWLRLGMGFRIIRLNYPKGRIDYRIEPEDIRTIQSIENDGPFWLTEFGGNIGIHFKPVTISGNLVLVPSQKTNLYGFGSGNLGLGMSLELHELKRKKRKPKQEN